MGRYRNLKIAKIKFENHPVFKSSCFDFKKPNGEIYNNILIAGENEEINE